MALEYASGKVSQGNPALDPERRRRRDIVEKTRALDRESVQSKIRNDETTVASDGGLDTTNAEQQLGAPLSAPEFIRRLKILNSHLIFEVSNGDPTKYGIYIMQWVRDPLLGTHEYEKRFLVGFENGFMPEFSVRHFKIERVPDPDFRGGWRAVKTFAKETRGWRTVLMRLIRLGLIREPEMRMNFRLTRDSRNWQLLTS